MVASVQSAASLGVPLLAHLILWPVLIGWVVVLARGRRKTPWLRSDRVGFALAAATVVADLATIGAQRAWPTSRFLVFALLWLAVLLSVSAYLVLRAREDRDDEGSCADPDEPPWWPDFERQLRDYARRGRRPAPGRPRAPVAGS